MNSTIAARPQQYPFMTSSRSCSIAVGVVHDENPTGFGVRGERVPDRRGVDKDGGRMEGQPAGDRGLPRDGNGNPQGR